MNLPVLGMLTIAILALFAKVYLHYKLIEPQKRNLLTLTKYFGINFFLPVTKHYNSSRMENRRVNANRLLAFFYSCIVLAIVFML